MSGTTFHALFVEKGEIEIEWDGGKEKAGKGTSLLIPAALGSYILTGTATVLKTTLPTQQD
jgi:mannose-6-phosphate isomerase class I